MRFEGGYRAAAIAAALFVIAACGDDAPDDADAGPVCEDGCLSAPAAFCDGDERVSFASSGRCEAGTCAYDEGRESCTWGCVEGACATEAEVCPDGCPAQGEARCDGDVATLPRQGRCSAELRACEANDERIDCAALGQVCVDGDAGPSCVAETPATCTDGTQNGDETDVDCGGACAVCDAGASCSQASDCATGVCADGACAEPACEDGVTNGDESDLDCGGDCGACGVGSACRGDVDCTTGVCADGRCAEPTCDDATRNGDETDLDCGGSCGPCPDTFACGMAADCASGICESGACVVGTCDDGVLNQSESAVDCGGPCRRCEGGEACNLPTDCESNACSDGVCSEPGCDDGTQNGDETGVDCGGSCDATCEVGAGCLLAGDCGSGVCLEGVCFRGCSDGVRNGPETDVDCGGDCTACGLGRFCDDRFDCSTNRCEDGVCAPPTCDDGVRNGAETGVDCGGGCEGCPVGGRCLAVRDCLSRTCDDGVCVEARCDDGLDNGDETDVDCGGSCSTACEIGQGCAETADCVSGECVLGICRASCDDGVRNGAEWGVDCGGPCVGCPVGAPCGDARDCAALICDGLPGEATVCEDEAECGAGTCDDGVCAGRCGEASCDDGVRNGGELDIDCGGPCPGAPCAVECAGDVVVIDLNDAAAGEGTWFVPASGAAVFPNNDGTFFPTTGQCFDRDRGGGPEVVHRFEAPTTGTYRIRSNPIESPSFEEPTVAYVLERACETTAFELGCGASDLGSVSSSLQVELEAGQVYFIVVDSDFSDAGGARYELEVVLLAD